MCENHGRFEITIGLASNGMIAYTENMNVGRERCRSNLVQRYTRPDCNKTPGRPKVFDLKNTHRHKTQMSETRKPSPQRHVIIIAKATFRKRDTNAALKKRTKEIHSPFCVCFVCSYSSHHHPQSSSQQHQQSPLRTAHFFQKRKEPSPRQDNTLTEQYR